MHYYVPRPWGRYKLISVHADLNRDGSNRCLNEQITNIGHQMVYDN